jgi:hypothetical protein
VNCEVCGQKIRIDNTIGVCRRHRSQSLKTKARLDLWKKQNQEHLRNYKKTYAEKYKERSNLLTKIRLKENINARLAHAIRTRLNRALNGKRRDQSTKAMLGCSYQELRVYIEGKFKAGMNWNNYGIKGWHLDHIRPLSSFDLTNQKEMAKACHYTNLQPLWHFENSIKRDRIEPFQECPTTVRG